MRVAKTLCIVILFFIVAWSPFFTLTIVFEYPKYFPMKLTPKVLYYLPYFVKFLHFSNSAVNPFIYAFRQQEYANAFKSIVFGSKFRRGLQANYTRTTFYSQRRGINERENNQTKESIQTRGSSQRENSQRKGSSERESSAERGLISQRESSRCSEHTLSRNASEKDCCETIV